jgi:acyl carrier protein
MNVHALRTFIQNEILNDPDFEIDADQDLLLTETLNSLSVTMLIAHIEMVCSVHIPPEDVTLENFGKLRAIESYIRSLHVSAD